MSERDVAEKSFHREPQNFADFRSQRSTFVLQRLEAGERRVRQRRGYLGRGLVERRQAVLAEVAADAAQPVRRHSHEGAHVRESIFIFARIGFTDRITLPQVGARQVDVTDPSGDALLHNLRTKASAYVGKQA